MALTSQGSRIQAPSPEEVLTGYLSPISPLGTTAQRDTTRAAAHQASRRMIARGDRPAHRVTTAQDGRWRVDTLPWVRVNRDRAS